MTILTIEGLLPFVGFGTVNGSCKIGAIPLSAISTVLEGDELP